MGKAVGDVAAIVGGRRIRGRQEIAVGAATDG
jgi:hypothetical protein